MVENSSLAYVVENTKNARQALEAFMAAVKKYLGEDPFLDPDDACVHGLVASFPFAGGTVRLELFPSDDPRATPGDIWSRVATGAVLVEENEITKAVAHFNKRDQTAALEVQILGNDYYGLADEKHTAQLTHELLDACYKEMRKQHS